MIKSSDSGQLNQLLLGEKPVKQIFQNAIVQNKLNLDQSTLPK